MQNRVAIISGASSGIGRATAMRLACKGIKMILTGRDEVKLLEVAKEVSQIAHADISRVVAGDISDPGVTASCIAKCRRSWMAPPSIFIASAGRGLPGTVIDSDPLEWDKLIDTNIKGLLCQLRGIGKAMLEQVSADRDLVQEPLDIVVIGSSIGRNVSPFNSVYGATKFAAHGLTEALRRQLGPKGIRVTLIEPGIVDTNFQQSAGYSREWFDGYKKEIGPVLEAADIASVIDFLLDLPGNVNLDNVSIRPTRQAYP